MQRKQSRTSTEGEEWKCPTCNRWFSRSGFYPSKKTWNGITSQCRNCHIKGSIETRDKELAKKARRESARRCRKLNPEKFRARERVASRKRKKDERWHARMLVHHALKLGLLNKPEECSKCNRKIKLTAHHPNYSAPLNVEWLCYECHGNR